MSTEERWYFPFEPMDYRNAIAMVDRVLSRVRPDAVHTSLPLPSPENERVAILIDGLGSSSAGLYAARVSEWLGAEGFATCVFSYRGFGTDRYDPPDTVFANFEDLTRYLDEYVEYYRNSECLVLVGYSFGGLVISDWLYRRAREGRINLLSCIDGVCLITSPIRLRATRVRLSRQPSGSRTLDAKDQVDRILMGYSAIPEHVPLITDMHHIWSDRDGIFPPEAYSFRDRPLEDRPHEHILSFPHQEIIQREELRIPLIESVNALCEHRVPNFA